MKTYSWLRRWLPRSAALALTLLWMLIMILLSLYFGFEPQAEFRYENI